MAYPGARDTPIEDIPSLVEKYRKIKEKELADGQRKKLLRELESGNRYLEGVSAGMIPDMHGNIMYLRSKMDVLQDLLGPIHITYVDTPTTLNKDQIEQAEKKIFYLFGRSKEIQNLEEFKKRLLSINTDPTDLESPRLSKIIIFVKNGREVRLDKGEFEGECTEYVIEKVDGKIVMSGKPVLNEDQQRELFKVLANEIVRYGHHRE